MTLRPVRRRTPLLGETGDRSPGSVARGWRHRRRPTGRPLSTTFGVLAMAAIALFGLVGTAGTVALPGTASAQPDSGLLTGNVVVRDAPVGFSGEVGVVACPSGSSRAALCPSPQYAYSGSGGSYTLELAAGSWDVYTFYSLGYSEFTPGGPGGSFIGRSKAVTIGAGATVRLNIGVRYQVPSAVSGTLAVSGLPGGVTVYQYQVTACPASTPMVGDIPSPLCASDYLSPDTTAYSLPTLSKGTWLLYLGYDTAFGPSTAATPVTVKLKAGESTTVDLSTPYVTPTDALVEGTVTVTGAPPGFAETATIGVGGCPSVGGTPEACPEPEYTLSTGGDPSTYELTLAPGPWTLAGFYELAFYGGQFLSALQPVNLAPGTVVNLNFTVPYEPPATIRSKVTVTGVPPGQSIADTALLACPVDFPYEGGLPQPIECVSTESPPGVPNLIDTLPPGTWLLYPGYVTSLYDEVIGTTPTSVTLRSGHTRTKNLTIAFGAP
jgi:hypothetical protein